MLWKDANWATIKKNTRGLVFFKHTWIELERQLSISQIQMTRNGSQSCPEVEVKSLLESVNSAWCRSGSRFLKKARFEEACNKLARPSPSRAAKRLWDFVR